MAAWAELSNEVEMICYKNFWNLLKLLLHLELEPSPQTGVSCYCCCRSRRSWSQVQPRLIQGRGRRRAVRAPWGNGGEKRERRANTGRRERGGAWKLQCNPLCSLAPASKSDAAITALHPKSWIGQRIHSVVSVVHCQRFTQLDMAVNVKGINLGGYL